MAEAHAKNHPYHLVDPSPWPLVGAVAAFAAALGAIAYMHGASVLWTLPGLLGIAYTMIVWWRDVVKEAHSGFHTRVVQLGLRYGMILFIASEVMFFVAWFWAYFDAALFPGAIYPIDVTAPDGTVEASKEVFGMIKRDELFGGHWPPKAGEIAETNGYFHG